MRTNRKTRKLALSFAALCFAASLTLVGPSTAFADGMGGDPPPPPVPTHSVTVTVQYILMSLNTLATAL